MHVISKLTALSLMMLSSAATLSSARAEDDAVRLGLFTIRSGPIAYCGRQAEQGYKLAATEAGDKIGGRKVVLTIGDTAGQPAQARTKAQELVEKAKVNVLIGPVAVFEILAMADYLKQAEVPILPVTSADDITQRKASPWMVRTTPTSSQPMHPLGDYAAKTLGYKRIATLADDAVFGLEGTVGFQRTFEEAGGKVVQRLWAPLNVTDYGPYIADLKTDVDAIFIGLGSTNGLRFLKQYKAYGLKTPLLGASLSIDDSIMGSYGDEALGMITANNYSAAQAIPANQKFVAGMRSTFQQDPGLCTLAAYLAYKFIDAAATKTGGNVDDKVAFVQAMRGLKIEETPVGPVSFDDKGQMISNIYIKKVERKDGKMVNAVIATYPAVSQFWTYAPAEYLAQPPYSRDYPPAKFIE
jgi:branched-chain amino acid transport system substrate-binding protein